MCEFWAHILPPGSLAAGQQPKTRVWAYIEGEKCPPNGREDPALDTYIGPVIISERSRLPSNPRPPTTITWVNELGTTETTQVLAYKNATDQTLHWADPNRLNCAHHQGNLAFGSPCAKNYAGPIPAVVHLHGGEVPHEAQLAGARLCAPHLHGVVRGGGVDAPPEGVERDRHDLLRVAGTLRRIAHQDASERPARRQRPVR